MGKSDDVGRGRPGRVARRENITSSIIPNECYSDRQRICRACLPIDRVSPTPVTPFRNFTVKHRRDTAFLDLSGSVRFFVCEAGHRYLTALKRSPRRDRGLGSPDIARPQPPNTIDFPVARAIRLARAGRHADAARICADALKTAPPGVAGWLLPAEPMLNPIARPEIWAEALVILRDRAI